MSFSPTQAQATTQTWPTDIVAVDDGYARVKICGVPPNSMISQPPKLTLVKSSARAGRNFAQLGNELVASWEADGEEFTVAANLDSEDTRFADFHWSPLNRILVAHSLASSGWSGRTIKRLYLGMPLRNYFNASGAQNSLVNRKVANLFKSVTPTGGGLVAPIYENIKVLAQAMAGYVDRFVDFNGHGVGIVPESAAVIDVGGRTTDIAFIRKGVGIDMKQSVTEEIGVLDVHARLDELLQQRFERPNRAEHSVLDGALRNKVITFRGNKVDVSAQVDEAVKEIESKLHRVVSRVLGNADSIEHVLLIGGGAEVFTGLQGRIRHAEIAENPSFANARGLWKYAAYYAAN